MPIKLKALALAAALGLAAALPAAAAPIHIRDGNGGTVFNGGPGSVNVTINVDGSNVAVAAGAFALEYATTITGPWTDFLAYCLEPDELLGVAGLTPLPGSYAATPAATAEYAARAAALGGLFAAHFAHSLTSATRSAAFQIALWEVAYDSGNDLGAGRFRFTASGAVLNQAKAYLTNWTATGDEPGVILRPGSQDLLTAALPIPVPEPATLALFGTGVLGLLALRHHRRRRAG